MAKLFVAVGLLATTLACKSFEFGGDGRKGANGKQGATTPANPDAVANELSPRASSYQGFLPDSLRQPPAQFRQMTLASAQNELTGDPKFFFIAPTFLQYNCLEEALVNIPLDATNDEVSVDKTIDMNACAKSIFPGGQLNISQAKARVFFKATCLGDNLASYQGQNIKAFLQYFCGTASRGMTYIYQAQFTGNASMTAQQAQVSYSWVISRSTSSQTGRGCIAIPGANNEWTFRDCVDYGLSEYKDVKANGQVVDASKLGYGNDYHSYNRNGLTGARTGERKFYNLGTMPIQINNWKGDMVYAGAIINPTFGIHYKGEQVQNVTFTGTSKPDVKLALTSSGTPDPVRTFWRMMP